MTDLINIVSSTPSLLWVNQTDIYGGKQINLSLSSEFDEMLTWFRKHKLQMYKEQKAREEHQSVAAAYEQYQTVLNLVLD